jgi:phosphoribosylcarboxyaminoimidazole (NCAIR) mutase
VLAAAILAGDDKALSARLEAWRKKQTDAVSENVDDQ